VDNRVGGRYIGYDRTGGRREGEQGIHDRTGGSREGEQGIHGCDSAVDGGNEKASRGLWRAGWCAGQRVIGACVKDAS